MNKCMITNYPTTNKCKGMTLHPNIVELAKAQRDLDPHDRNLKFYLRHLQKDFIYSKQAWPVGISNNEYVKRLNAWLTEKRSQVMKKLNKVNGGDIMRDNQN